MEDNESWVRDEENEDRERVPGLNGMMRAFVGRTKFSWKYEEDLDDIVESFETYANMCGLSDSKRRKVIPWDAIMLNGKQLSLLNQRSTEDQTYYQAIQLLKKWFSSREKQRKILREWNGMRLT